MIRKTSFITLIVLFVVTAGCGKKTEQVATSETVVTESTTAAGSTSSPVTTQPVTTQPVPTTQPAPVAATAVSSANAPAISSQETNWQGVTADVTEFRRKGNTLTAKVRYRNSGTEQKEPDIRFADAYVMDANAGKKYQVLRDEKGVYIAMNRPGYDNRWYEYLKPGEHATIWMKFPAPPLEVKAVTLQLPNVPPFEDVPIQD